MAPINVRAYSGIDHYECQAELGDIAVILDFKCKIVWLKYLLLNKKDVGLPRAEKRMETRTLFLSNASLLYEQKQITV